MHSESMCASFERSYHLRQSGKNTAGGQPQFGGKIPDYGRGAGVRRARGVGVGLAVGVGVGTAWTQYFPPVLKLVVSSVPPQTIISLPVQTAV